MTNILDSEEYEDGNR